MMRTTYHVRVSAYALLAVSLGGGSAWADEAISSANPDGVETITIISSGSARQAQSIDNQALLEAAPGTTALKELSLLPGVNLTDSDPFGSYEWGMHFSARGFNQTQLGYTLDGVPLGNMDYMSWNGLTITRAIINENVDKATISQGSGALGTASNSNLGGTVQFTSLTPADKFGTTLSQSFGSDDLYRTYARVDSGLLPSNTKFSISAVGSTTDTWKGNFPQRSYQVNGKIVQQVGEDNTFTAFLNYSDHRETDYQDLSKNYLSVLGYNWTNYTNWGDAVNAARGIYTHGEQATNDPLDAAYGGSSGLRQDTLGGMTLESSLTDNLTLKTTVYGHNEKGDGLWVTPYQNSPTTGAPLSLRDTEIKQLRGGLTSDLSWQVGSNTVTGGMWYENESFDDSRKFYDVSLTSSPDMLEFPSGSSFYGPQGFDIHYRTSVIQGYIQDSYKFENGVTVTAGFKGTDTSITAHPLVGDYASGTLTASDPFLPQMGATWALTPGDEVFADVAKNMRTFSASPLDGQFLVSQAAFDSQKLSPETSWTEEVGYRLKRGPVSATIDAYHVDFHNRLQTVESGPIIDPTQTVVNVGSVASNGVELSTNWKFFSGFNWYNGIAYNRSTYGDNVTDSTGFHDIKGKTLVDTPDFTYRTQLGYHIDGYFGTLTGNYMSKRYFTYTNDESVPDYIVFDLGLGYRADEIGPLHDVRFQFNVTNLFDKKYVATIGTNGFSWSGDYQTLQVGAPRAFYGTVSVSF